MGPKTIATILVGIGMVFLVVVVVCRIIIVRHAAKAGIRAGWWIEPVDFPGRKKVVGLLVVSLIAGLALFVAGMFYSAKARKDAQHQHPPEVPTLPR